MVDVAELVAQARTDGVDKTTLELRELSTAAGGAQKSVESVGVAARSVSPHMMNMNRALEAQQKQLRATQQAGLGLTRQFSDIGVSIASGMPIWMVFVQQGSQVQDQFAQMKMQGVGLSAAMRGVVASFVPFLAVLAPIALAAGAVAAGFGLLYRELSKGYPKDITEGLNLTAEQLERVKTRTVTFGDTVQATFKVIGDRIRNGPVGDGLTWLGQRFSEIMDFVSNVVFEAAARIYGVFAGTYKTIIEMWRSFPAVLGDLAITGVNYLIRAFNQLPVKIAQIASQVLSFFAGAWGGIKAGAEALPGAIQAAFGRAFRGAIDIARSAIAAIANGLKSLSTAALDAFRGTVEAAPEIGARIAAGVSNALSGAPMISAGPMIAELDNQFAGAGATLATSLFANIAAETEAAREAMRDLGSDIADDAEAIRRRAAIAEAGDAAAASAERQARAVKEIETLWANVNQQVRDLNINIPEILDPLDIAVRNLTLIDDLVRSAGRGMEESFGRAGTALAGLAEGLSGYRVQMAEIDQAVKDKKLWGTEAILERRRVELQTYGDLASSAKSFFGERTAAYKALQAVEMAYRAVQFAGAVQAMALDTAETGSSIGNSIARGAAYAAEAVANIFAKLGPWGFPVAAAALGVIAAVGGKAMGGGGSSAVPTLPSTNTGTGTVLGAGGEQSDSLARSLETAERYQNRDLEFSSRSLNALRAIQANIGSLTTAIAREMNVGGGLDPTGLNQGPTTSGGFLGAFSTTRSSELVGSGISLSGGALADLIAQGVSGGLYQIVQTTSRNSGFFGIGASTRTTNNETSTALDGGLSREFSRVLASLRDGVLTAAGDLGLAGAEALLDAFQVSLGRISFDGMSSSEISETLNAVFSAVGDDMARAILPGLDAFQRAGEGMLETLSRLASEYRTVDVTLQSIGMTFGAVGLASVEARSRLVELSGGLDAFTEGASFFAENFLTDAQRIAPVQAAVTAELTRLGVASDISRSGFASLVMGLDVSAEAGSSMFAALMRLAPALDQTLSYAEELTGAVTDLGTAVDNTADIARQRRSLEIALMEAQGNASGALAARRQDEIAALFEVNQPLQLAIYAALDLAAANEALARQQTEAAAALAQVQQEAAQAVDQARSDLSAAYEREASALKSTQERFDGFAKSLSAFRASLDLDSGLSGASYDVAGSQFRKVADLAALGNEQALGELQGVSQAYLEASKSYSKDSLGYLKDLSAVKIALQRAEGTASRTASNAQQQLAALDASVSGLLTVNNSVLSVRDAIMRLQAALAGQASLSTAAPSWSGQTAGQDYGANPGINRALAGLTGYSGAFSGGAFEAWITGQNAMVQGQARSFLAANDIIPGFATGGSFTVGGSGGPDSQVIPLRLTPGEMVDVKRPGDNDNSEITALRQDVARLTRAMEQVVVNTGKAARSNEEMRDDLDFVVNGGGVIKTEAA